MIGFCWNWLKSKRFRGSVQIRHGVRKHLNFQRDLLSPAAIEALEGGMRRLTETLHDWPDRKRLDEETRALEAIASKWLKPYAFQGLRDNVEVLLVVVTLLMAFRTFFFQPMAIPTGSAQPTLYGIVVENLKEKEATEQAEIPTGLSKWYHSWVRGESYFHVKARNDGLFRPKDTQPDRLFPMVSRLRFYIGEEMYTLWFPPARNGFWREAGLRTNMYFKKGEDILKVKVDSGDHLFVNRLIYNFRRPRRGETIVFRSTGLPGLTANTHYIKRLVALGGEKVSIGDDRRIRIDGEALDASHPGFELVYDFDPDGPPRVSAYSGHVNNEIGRKYLNSSQLAPLFENEEAVYQVDPDHYMTFGDNTLNSRDSRAWGSIPREKVIGRSSFVFWPVTDRFGWHVR